MGTLWAGAESHGASITFDDRPLQNPSAQITFNEVSLGSQDPSYDFDIPAFGPLQVKFGSLFQGQRLGAGQNSLDKSEPNGPLMLDEDGPTVATLLDLQSAAPPVLGGSAGGTYFTTPLAIAFDRPVNAVSFEVGSFDRPNTTFVEVYDASGNTLGRTQNRSSSFEVISVRSTAINIAGVSVYVTDNEMDWEGFGLNNVAVTAIPEPSGGLLCLALFLLGMLGKRHGSF